MIDSFYAAGQINSVALDINGNLSKLLDLCTKAAKQGIEFVAFPELCIPGADCGDIYQVPAFMQQCAQAVLSLKYNLPDGVTAGVGTVLQGLDGHAYDAYVLVRRGAIVGISAASAFNDSRDPRVRSLTTAGPDETFVLGAERIAASRIHDVGGRSVGVYFSIADIQALKNADLVVAPANERYELGGRRRREIAAAALSLALDTTVVTTSLCGCEGGSSIYDGLSLIAEKGNIVAASSELTFKRERLFTPDQGIAAPLPEYDQIVRAVALGLYDWMLKTRASGFALSLSGGADSGLCATAVCLGLISSLREQGYDEFKKQLESVGLPVPPFDGGDVEAYVKGRIMPKALITVYQGSDVSGSVTRTAAKEVASGLGATHYEWSISKLVEDYTSIVNSTTPDNPLSWEHDDLTLQNIQARCRAPGIWMIANRYNKLLLTTCNASEDAVGYCTMDGDTCGGLAPIGDISKSRILKINRHIADEGIKVDSGLTMHLPQMSYIAAQAPTAELKPGQTDERDLMPYAVLDAIHQMQQGSLYAPARIASELGVLFPEYSEEQRRTFVRRYFSRLATSQWKRERGATTFHIERNDLGKGSGFVFPILNDGFRGLLSDLKD
jgi:NAD+ synthase (glutamine-hydrolysing)